jgi:hypothetical protein
MHTMTAAQAEQQLTDLAEQFAQWRQQRTYRFAPFPRPLWEHAIALTAVLPLADVAKRLRLRGRDLQKRCATRPQRPCADPTPPAVDFVEIPAASAWPLPAPSTEIEVHRADGARLWMRSHEPQLPLAALLRTFLEKP